MRSLLWSVGALMMAVAAAPADEKNPPPGAPLAQPAQPPQKGGAVPKQASGEKGEKPSGERSEEKGPADALNIDDEASLLKTLAYMQGYGAGKTLFEQFKQQGINLDETAVLAAFKDGLAGKGPEMTEEAMKKILPHLEKYVSDRYVANAKERGIKIKAEGEAFLAENKKKEGVKTLPSGLQYKVLKSGSGEAPKQSDRVKVHYRGSLLDGKEFDSSYKKGVAVPLQVNRVIKGWSEALQLMKVGDKWQLFVPPNLAYEEKGAHDQQGNEIIPPNSTLVFEIELLGIDSVRKTVPTSK
ncbi:MAG TPA: FKBP-type peptidyl-prolyl cis-trans isomerase [Pirellulales bacterium]|nr:FKBP-type peptidyl-prolyl cis-trans isomerase [Pirellulales bacterium]